MSKTTTQKLITIREDQKEWLEKNTDINFSGFVRIVLDLYIEEKISITDIITKKIKSFK